VADFDIDGALPNKPCRRTEAASVRVGGAFCNEEGTAEGSNSRRAKRLAAAEEAASFFSGAAAEPFDEVGALAFDAPRFDEVPVVLAPRGAGVASFGREGSSRGSEDASGAVTFGAELLEAEPLSAEPLPTRFWTPSDAS
jgi:hypothetical protein